MFNAKADICVPFKYKLTTSCYESIVQVGNSVAANKWVNIDLVHVVMLEWLFYSAVIAAFWQE